MTWERTVTVEAEDTFRDAAEREDISDLAPGDQRAFAAAVSAAEGMIDVDETPVDPDGKCHLVFSGEETDDARRITVAVQGFGRYVPQPMIDYDPMRDGHGQR